MEDGECRKHLPGTFFPTDGTGVTIAMSICASARSRSRALSMPCSTHRTRCLGRHLGAGAAEDRPAAPVGESSRVRLGSFEAIFSARTTACEIDVGYPPPLTLWSTTSNAWQQHNTGGFDYPN